MNQTSESVAPAKASRYKRRASPYTKFRDSSFNHAKVGSDPRQQAAARLLVKKRGLCAYQNRQGLIRDIGVPVSPKIAGRIFKVQPSPESKR